MRTHLMHVQYYFCLNNVKQSTFTLLSNSWTKQITSNCLFDSQFRDITDPYAVIEPLIKENKTRFAGENQEAIAKMNVDLE